MKAELVAVLHDIRSLHNVGSIFRTADGAGFTKLYLCGITPEPLDRLGHPRPELVKVALGAERSMASEYVRSTPGLLKKLKKSGWKIFAVEQAKGSVPYYSVIPAKAGIQKRGSRVKPGMTKQEHDKIVLVMGNEVEGLPSRILALADKIIEIPMHGAKESLNVAVAFGIVAYHLKHAVLSRKK